MGKNVYSIVLDDQIVLELDQFAGRCGISRSAAINQILAQHLQLATPQQQIQQIFAGLEQMAKETALQLLSVSQGQMQLRSPLQYKYNPTLRYQIELYSDDKQYMGIFRAGMRTQNQTLLAYLQQFYQMWNFLEKKYAINPQEICTQTENGRFVRCLRWLPPNHHPQQQGEQIAQYVHVFDQCLKAFFSMPETQGVNKIQTLYLQQMDSDLRYL